MLLKGNFLIAVGKRGGIGKELVCLIFVGKRRKKRVRERREQVKGVGAFS